MSNIFAASEVIELGVQIEKNGKDFYEGILAVSKNDSAKKLFKYLAGEEEKHIAVFQKLLVATEKYEPVESYAGEYSSYMRALAAESVFTKKNKGKETAKSVKLDKDALQLGIGFEKDSIIFYEGMKKVMPEYDHKIVNVLIEQEQSHLTQLSEIKNKL